MADPAASGRRLELRPVEIALVMATPLVAVVSVLWLSQASRPEPYTGQVIESSVEAAEEGFVGNVTWIDDEGTRHVRRLEMTAEQVESGSVLLTVTNAEIRVIETDQQPISVALLVTTALGALAFAIVVLATLRGLGYVRGTGRAGELTPDEVRESRAFYWRH